LLVNRIIKIKQLPWLASALSMTAGLYLLAGPFRSERSGPDRLVPLWALLTAYEFTVIGMIALLRRRGIETAALTIVSIFFLADPIFLGDAFASTSVEWSFLVNGAAGLLALLKAWTLTRARAFPLTPWLAGWVAAALIMICLVPSFIAASATRPAINAFLPQAASCVVAALAVPLFRLRRLGWIAIAALAVHFVAAGIVAATDFNIDLLSGPFAAAACVLPWPRWGWVPLLPALICSPLRPRAEKIAWTSDMVGGLLVGVAFLFLGVGLWRNLRVVPDRHPVS